MWWDDIKSAFESIPGKITGTGNAAIDAAVNAAKEALAKTASQLDAGLGTVKTGLETGLNTTASTLTTGLNTVGTQAI